MRCKWYNEVKGICTNARCAFFNSICGLGTKQDVCKYAENEPWPVPPKLSVEELVKALRVCTAINNCSEKCPLYDYGDAAVCESAMKQQAANMLEKLAAEKEAKKPEWISVKDRLPEERCKAYLCSLDSCLFPGSQYIDIRVFDSDGKWRNGTVTHWMPLPELPKEEAR